VPTHYASEERIAWLRPYSHQRWRPNGEGFSKAADAAGMRFAIEYYGIDNVMYGTDYPCWEPAQALKLIDELKLSPADKQKLFYDNARHILGLSGPAPQQSRREPALAK
jgi:predicted TIM-barrel fold metal-dependent hydrolase